MPYQNKTPPRPGAGSSADSIVEFELEPYHYAIPDRTLLADLLKVARRLKVRSLFAPQYSKHGRFSSTLYRQRFGSWNAALEAAHLEPSHSRLVEDSAILADIAQVAQRFGLGKLPRDVYFAHGQFGTTTISRRFGTWNQAVVAAGLVANPHPPRNPTNEELFENFELLWRTLGRQPRGRELVPPLSRFSRETYRKRFGSFRRALHFFIAYQKRIGKTEGTRVEILVGDGHKTDRQVRTQMRYRILRRDHFKCCSCGRSPATDPSVRLHVDHVKPWSRGGETVLENLQTLCETCNAGKSDL